MISAHRNILLCEENSPNLPDFNLRTKKELNILSWMITTRAILVGDDSVRWFWPLVFIGFLCPKQYHKIEKENKINSQNTKGLSKTFLLAYLVCLLNLVKIIS